MPGLGRAEPTGLEELIKLLGHLFMSVLFMLSFSCYVCLVCTGNTMLYGRVFLFKWRLFWRVSENVPLLITIKGVYKKNYGKRQSY